VLVALQRSTSHHPFFYFQSQSLQSLDEFLMIDLLSYTCSRNSFSLWFPLFSVLFFAKTKAFVIFELGKSFHTFTADSHIFTKLSSHVMIGSRDYCVSLTCMGIQPNLTHSYAASMGPEVPKAILPSCNNL
jgi:hypothetical protein